MSNYKPYPKYKESRVEWIREIPEGWSLNRLKRLSKIVTGNTPPMKDDDNYSEEGLMWIKPDDLMEFTPIVATKKYLSNIGAQLARRVPACSPLVCCIGSVGKFGYTETDASTNQQINSILFREKIINRRFGLYIISVSEKEFLRQSNINVVAILNSGNQGAVWYAVPTLREQQQIANFLDKKTVEIDDLIHKKERMIELLKEKRAAIINQAVTKGLDPNAKMKPSGIDWIGDIPEGWEMERLKYWVDLINEIELLDDDKLIVDLENIEGFTGKLLDEIEDSGKGMKEFKYEDVLFNKLRPYLAKVFFAERNGCCGGELLVLRHKKKIYAKFLFYRALSRDFINLVNNSSYGVKMPRANWDYIGNILLPFPEINVQKKIARYLDKKTNEIDSLVRRIECAIEKLREYRSSLITAAVTGKIDVRRCSV